MSARSEGDEAPLWLGHACQGGRAEGGEGPAAQCIGPVGVKVSKDTRIRPKDDYPHSHGEGIVIRSRAFVNNPSQHRLLRRASSAA